MPQYILDARTATPHFPGIGRYVNNLARAMAPLLAPDERLMVICDPAYPIYLPSSEAVQTIPLAVSPFSLRQQWAIPRLLRTLRRDVTSAIGHRPSAIVYHSPYIAMPYLPGVPALLTVYDLIPLRYPAHSTARARLFAHWLTRLALRAARQVVAISDFTRRDFLAEFRLAPERITAIPLAADPAFCPQPPEAIAAVRARYGLPETFALYLGSNKPHKNLVRLVEAWHEADCRLQIADCRLVVAGAWDARYPEARKLADALTTEAPIPNIQHPTSTPAAQAAQHPAPLWLGSVPEADLPALYAAATVFVFPSLYEGFGLPVLEAMACGTPVVCSNSSSLPEVAGDAALLVAPTDTAALAEALTRVLADAGLRSELRARGLAQARRFSWTGAARRTLDIYRLLAAG